MVKGTEKAGVYLLDGKFSGYVDTDWVGNTEITNEIDKLFEMRLEDLIDVSREVFQINKRLN